jgi:hypothetical protein
MAVLLAFTRVEDCWFAATTVAKLKSKQHANAGDWEELITYGKGIGTPMKSELIFWQST